LANPARVVLVALQDDPEWALVGRKGIPIVAQCHDRLSVAELGIQLRGPVHHAVAVAGLRHDRELHARPP